MTESHEEGEEKDPSSLTFYPFAYALFNDELSGHCWYCLTESTSLKQCLGCARARFCDKKCQSLGWKDHKLECKALRSTNEVPDIEIRLLGRIVARFRAIESGKAADDSNFYLQRSSRRTIMEIWSHTEDVRKDPYAMRKFEDIFARLTAFYGEKVLGDRETVFELHCRDFINRHAISDREYTREIGKGLYLDLCAYDHSCSPNTVYSSQGFVAILRPLSGNVKLLDRSTTFYSYIDLLNSKQERQKMLLDTWYFKCQCTRCVDDREHILTSMFCPTCPENDKQRLCLFGNQPYKDRITQRITCPKCLTDVPQEKVAEAIEAMRFIGRVLDQNEIGQMEPTCALSFLQDLLQRFKRFLPSVNVFYARLLQALISRTDPEDQETMLDIHLESEECVRTCFPCNHPSIAMHLRNIGVFNKNLERMLEARKYLEECRGMLEIALGVDHPMTASTAKLLDELKTDATD